MPATTNAVKNIIDVWRHSGDGGELQGRFTNTTPIAAYRGASRPEGQLLRERLIDTAAREMASTGSSCAGATTSRRARCPARRRLA